MNFFGHATVARWVERSPRWILGSMLPDFASMSRARLVGAEDPGVEAGIGFHHRTDDAFHSTPTFVRLNEDGAQSLEARGLGRGPARAVAHVGTELLLDDLLLEDDAACADYLEAVAEPTRALGLRFRGDGAERFTELRRRMAGVGLPDDYRHAIGVERRLAQALGRRSRLAYGPGDRPLVLEWLNETRRDLESSATGLLGEVRAALGELP